MATISVKDSSGTPVAVEKPLAPSRAAAAASRPVVLSNEDLAALARLAPPTLGASVDRTFNSGSQQSGAITGTAVRLLAKGADCRILIGANPTAPADGTLILAGSEYYFSITSGHKVAAIRDAGTDGTLNITVVG